MNETSEKTQKTVTAKALIQTQRMPVCITNE